MNALALTLPPEALEAIAQRVAELLADSSGSKDPQLSREYLTTIEAAEHLRCDRQRIFDLTSAGKLPVCKDGSRNLYRRADLDAYVAGGAS